MEARPGDGGWRLATGQPAAKWSLTPPFSSVSFSGQAYELGRWLNGQLVVERVVRNVQMMLLEERITM